MPTMKKGKAFLHWTAAVAHAMIIFLSICASCIDMANNEARILASQGSVSYGVLNRACNPGNCTRACNPGNCTRAAPAYTATDLILLNCGASTITNDTSHRSWDGDERSRYVPSNAASLSSASEASSMESSVFEVPYKTARVFHSPFTYTFPVSAGQIFLRLYFYPNVYSGLDTTQSFFSLTANAFTLFTNFSASLYSNNSSQPSFMVEFIVNIGATQRLILTFTPLPKSSAFVNGIEIVSIPDKLYFPGNDLQINFVDQVYHLDTNTTLENLYRLNVGGGRIGIQDDSGMFRGWNPDDDYIYGDDYGWTPHSENLQIDYTIQTPPYAAPPIVYTSARIMSNTSKRLEWGFPVDSGFRYLLRFHFCEFTQEIRKQNERVFTIYINNQIADSDVDIIRSAGGPQIPIFRDYVILVPYDGRGKQDLRLSLIPSIVSNPKYIGALLNGLEIFKLNNSERSLAAPSHEPIVEPSRTPTAMTPTAMTPPRKKTSQGNSLTYAVTGGAISVAVVIAISFLIHWRLHRVKKLSYSSDVAKSSWLPLSSASSSTASSNGTANNSHPSQLCRNFSLAEIKAATFNLDRNSIIGKGGFGCVYRGLIDDGATTVAIKRLNPSSNQGAHEFLTEIQMLSKLRHLHLVSLIGYCDEEGEMILVYDYMAHGSLHDHLYNSDNLPLSWKHRLQISMGAAKGLLYLHTGTEHAIIHRDVKSTNILLDHNWVAKISDFGLSKMGHSNDSFTHISTNVKGTFGYLDPKYISTHQLTRKSDVYAFGVVLFELLSGRAAVDVRLDEEQHSLAGWARYCVSEGEVDRLIEPKLIGKIAAACLDVFVGIAGRCIHIQPLERPTMADVVMGLELAMALQETAEEVEEDVAGSDGREVVVSVDDKTDL